MITKKELKGKILKYAYNRHLERKEPKAFMGPFNIQELGNNLSAFDGEMKYRFYEALHELYLQNLIMKDPCHDGSRFSFTLTTRGKEIAEKQLDIDEYSLRLENFVEDRELIEKCQESFNSGEYETAIFSAYRLLEIKVREKAELTENDIGKGLMQSAFAPKKTSKLQIPTCKTEPEEVGALNLFLGAIQFIRNPHGHRVVDYENPRTALRIMVFAELLLELVNMAVKRQ